MRTAAYKDLMNLGFPEYTSRDIIREAKRIMLCFLNVWVTIIIETVVERGRDDEIS